LTFNSFNDVVPIAEIMWPEMRLVCDHGGYISTGILLGGFLSNILAHNLKCQNFSP